MEKSKLDINRMFRGLDVIKQGFVGHSEFVTQQTQNFTKKYPNSYLTTQTDPSVLQSSATGLGVWDPNTRQITQRDADLKKLLVPVNISDQLTQQHQQCITSDIDSLIGSQNLKSKVRCGWIYQKGTPGNNPVVSQGTLGTRAGPVAFFDHPKGTYYWNLDEAKKQILKDRCGALKTCTDVGTDDYKECAFSKTRGTGIPVDARGRVKYPRDITLTAPHSSLVTSADKCAPPPAPSTKQYIQQQSRDICTPLPDGRLSRDCVLQQVTAAGCKQDGELYQQLLTTAQPNNYAAGLVDSMSFKRYQQLATMPLTESVIKDGSTTKSVATANFKALASQSSKVNKSALNFASRDLCLKSGIMETYDFCNDLTDTSPAPFDLTCLQKLFRKLGGQPSGTMYPTRENKAMYDGLGNWKAVNATMEGLANKALAKADSFIDAYAQKKALTEFLGIKREPLDNSYICGTDVRQPGIFVDNSATTQRFRLLINKNISPTKPASFIQSVVDKHYAGAQMEITVTRTSDKNVRKFRITKLGVYDTWWDIESTGQDAYQYSAFYKEGDAVLFTFSQYMPPYTSLGCFNDGIPRALDSPSMRRNTPDTCYKIAVEQNKKYFSVQDQDECYVGNSGHDRYGKAKDNCLATGGPMVAHTYLNDKYVAPLPCIYRPTADNTNIITPTCPASYPKDGQGLARCFYPSLEEAKKVCDADSTCTGVSYHPGAGYEPRDAYKKLPGNGTMGFNVLPGFKSWIKDNCNGVALPSPPLPPEQKYTEQLHVDHSAGDDIECIFTGTTKENCKAKCDNNPECNAYNIITRNGWRDDSTVNCCLKKSGVPITNANPSVKLYTKAGAATPPPAPVTVGAQCQNSFNIIIGSLRVIPMYVPLGLSIQAAVNTPEKINYFCSLFKIFKPDMIFKYPADMNALAAACIHFRQKYP